ncbi:hypothetical protein IWW39_004708 [Coemansia spiralis]|uniref:SH3b domain-containing protein n=1 Tax=Coemansia spiralis TaxID=417178 RepID=A0A9W8L342_9FUNG|nr:hypothetical protein IWW39_004708 [Coemansia spiralis]
MRYSAATLALLALFSATEAFDIIHAANLNCRAGPATRQKIVKVYSLGDDVQIVCQVTGERVSGTNVWDMTPDNCYVLDYYLATGYSGIFMPLCNATSSSGATSSKTTRSSAVSTTGSNASSTTPDSKATSSASSSSEPESSETESESEGEPSDSDSSQTSSENDAVSTIGRPTSAGLLVAALGTAIFGCVGYW